MLPFFVLDQQDPDEDDLLGVMKTVSAVSLSESHLCFGVEAMLPISCFSTLFLALLVPHSTPAATLAEVESGVRCQSTSEYSGRERGGLIP